MSGSPTVDSDWQRQADQIRRRRYGVIEVCGGRLQRMRFRWFPKSMTLLELCLTGRWRHGRRRGDCCRLYFNQPRGCSNFLAVPYLESSRDATPRTIAEALRVLDEVARLKSADALLCDVANSRISDRLLNRLGWESHKPQRWHRNYIKRFYGDYPDPYDPTRPKSPAVQEPLIAAVSG